MLFHPSSLLLAASIACAVPTYKPFILEESDQVIQGSQAGFPGFDLNELRLVQFGDDEAPVWITELSKIEAKAKGRKFMDLTDTPTLGFSNWLEPGGAHAKYTYPSPGQHSSDIKKIHKVLDVDHMKAFLKQFSGFKTRYYRSETGKQSQQFLLSTLKSLSGHHRGVSISEHTHSWGQNSIIARFEPLNSSNADEPMVIIGAHQDSTNNWPFLPAPGADDDGSGTTSSLEAFCALAHFNYTPEVPVEFHYYSAEEGGLLGSQAVAKSYEDEGTKVLAMLQMDMTAWVQKGTTESVGIIQDFVDPTLTAFLGKLVEKYLSIPPVETKCGYACSDHASFRKAGYQSAFAIESTFEQSNHNIHTTQDTMDHPEFSFTHMREFSKLCVAFALELGGLGKKIDEA